MVSNNESCQVFVESFPKLSVVNLYISGSRLNETITLHSHEDRIYFPSLNVGTSFAGLRFEPAFNKAMQTFQDGIGHFRLLTRPLNTLSGSAHAEVVSRNNQNSIYDKGIINLLKNSLNTVPLMESTPYVVKCRMCKAKLSQGTSIQFSKIRPLPGANWEEYANDLWFCHHPHHHPKGNCTHLRPNSSTSGNEEAAKSTEDAQLVEDLSSVQISETSESDHETAFTAIRAPDKKSCYYGPCYWAVNPDNFPGIICQEIARSPCVDKSDILNFPAICSKCSTEIGIYRTEKCAILWDYGITWVSDSLKDAKEEFGLENVTDKAAQSFQKIVFAALHEWSFNLTCKLLVKPVNWDKSLFLWNIDRNLAIYEGQLLDNNNANSLKLQRVVKFMFCTVAEGKLQQENLYSDKVFENGGDENQIFVPTLVLQQGIRLLENSSAMYPTSTTALNCGYLKLE